MWGPRKIACKGQTPKPPGRGGLGADTLSGGTSIRFCHAGACHPNADTVTYAPRTNNVFADADGAPDDGELGEGDNIRRNVEHIVGGSGNDVLLGTVLSGGGGNDVLRTDSVRGSFMRGGRGNDRLLGGREMDFLEGGRGDDVLRGSRGTDWLWGQRGDDRLVGGRGRDRLRGGKDADLLLARDGRADVVNGGSGRDQGQIDDGLDRIRYVEEILP